jgi:membrane protein
VRDNGEDHATMTREGAGWLAAIERAIWTPRLATLPLWKKRAVRAVRMTIVLVRDLIDGNGLTLWTMSLVYTTLLSMVPLLALSFSVLKAFGVHYQIEPLLANLLAPLGPDGAEVTHHIIGFIERMNVGVLGAVGLALLLYTVVSLIQKIEESFNAIWHITQLRSLGDRFSRYLSVLLVGPILLFAALGITAMAVNSKFMQWLLAFETIGGILAAVGAVIPYLLVIAAFTFLYVFVPNTRVRFGPALAAGVVAGVLWQTAGWAFAAFVATSAQYAAIYSSFAILVLFLIWLYVSWLVLLFGADVAFYLQHPEYLYAMPGEPRLSNRMRERLALAVMQLVGGHFVRGEPPWTLYHLTRRLAVPMHSVEAVVRALIDGALLKETKDDPPGYLPARDLAEVSAASVLATVRTAGEAGFLTPEALPLAPALEDFASRVESAVTEAGSGVSVRTLVDAAGDWTPPEAPPS